jgi:hypothetical protein
VAAALRPPGPLKLTVEWPSGVDVTGAELDGSPLTATADQSIPYWPGSAWTDHFS